MSNLSYIIIPVLIIILPSIVLAIVGKVKLKLSIKDTFINLKKELITSSISGIILLILFGLILLNFIMFEGITFMEVALFGSSIFFILFYALIQVTLVRKTLKNER